MRRAIGPGARRGQKGFTLIELVIAVAILAMGTMAAYRSFDQAQRGIGGQLDRALASEVALNRAAELRLYGLGQGRALPRVVTQAGIEWQVEVRESGTSGGLIEASILVTAENRPGARVTIAVPERRE